jgi:two-component system, NarL family, response regulator
LSDGGGSGRKGKTAIGAGDGGESDGTSPLSGWPDEPNLVGRPRTVICERDELLRSGLKAMIAPFVKMVGEAADGMTASEMIRRLRPDLVILDIDLDVLNGVDVCRRATSALPNCNVLILTDSYHATKYYNQLVRAGARGFCLKIIGPRALYEALEQVTRALPYTDPEITKLVKQAPNANLPISNITDRKIEVMIRLDFRNKEIADELDMKLRTVQKHIECILAKLQVPTRTAAALQAVQLGYVLLPKMSGRDPVTGVSLEHVNAVQYAKEAISRQSL